MEEVRYRVIQDDREVFAAEQSRLRDYWAIFEGATRQRAWANQNPETRQGLHEVRMFQDEVEACQFAVLLRAGWEYKACELAGGLHFFHKDVGASVFICTLSVALCVEEGLCEEG